MTTEDGKKVFAHSADCDSYDRPPEFGRPATGDKPCNCHVAVIDALRAEIKDREKQRGGSMLNPARTLEVCIRTGDTYWTIYGNELDRETPYVAVIGTPVDGPKPVGFEGTELPEDGKTVVRLSSWTVQELKHPIDMLLFCPNCNLQHIDAPEEGWDNPPHRSHTCRPKDGGCGTIWRPADVATNGVRAICTNGSADTWRLTRHAQPSERSGKP